MKAEWFAHSVGPVPATASPCQPFTLTSQEKTQSRGAHRVSLIVLWGEIVLRAFPPRCVGALGSIGAACGV